MINGQNDKLEKVKLTDIHSHLIMDGLSNVAVSMAVLGVDNQVDLS